MNRTRNRYPPPQVQHEVWNSCPILGGQPSSVSPISIESTARFGVHGSKTTLNATVELTTAPLWRSNLGAALIDSSSSSTRPIARTIWPRHSDSHKKDHLPCTTSTTNVSKPPCARTPGNRIEIGCYQAWHAWTLVKGVSWTSPFPLTLPTVVQWPAECTVGSVWLSSSCTHTF